FRNPNGTVGTIRTNGSSTSYYTSSDYRLKENVVTDWDAIPKDLASFLNNIEREEKFIYLRCIIILYTVNDFNETHQWLLNAILKGGHSEDIHFGDKTKWSHLARKMEFKDLRDYDLCIKEMEVHIIGNLKEYFI
ncbi:hypothetical protein N8976_03815, partial [Gammaproteobacteria bacterium]|nr:hypothetical protein [Gammaproteobacteria bacterium]